MGDTMDQAELLRRCRAGDELAWEVLVRNYQARICSIAYGYTGDPDEARDLAQDIFVRVYRKLDTCRDPERLLPWLIRIARNVCLDHLRRRKVRPPAQDIPADELVSLADPAPSPEQQWLTNTRKRLVIAAMQNLSKINREIILLKDMQGLPLDEIAGMLDLPLGTVKSRCSRARVELAKAVIALSGGGQDAEVAS
jgi:RNA polymerase sigma-70 factor (ECF subfamily)